LELKEAEATSVSPKPKLVGVTSTNPLVEVQRVMKQFLLHEVIFSLALLFASVLPLCGRTEAKSSQRILFNKK
jgi:hypothetical protein